MFHRAKDKWEASKKLDHPVRITHRLQRVSTKDNFANFRVHIRRGDESPDEGVMHIYLLASWSFGV